MTVVANAEFAQSYMAHPQTAFFFFVMIYYYHHNPKKDNPTSGLLQLTETASPDSSALIVPFFNPLLFKGYFANDRSLFVRTGFKKSLSQKAAGVGFHLSGLKPQI